MIWSASKDGFPYLTGVSVIIISWFTSPLLCAIVGAGLFWFTRTAGAHGPPARHAVPAGWVALASRSASAAAAARHIFAAAAAAVLRRQNSFKLSLWMLPLFGFITVYIGCFYIIQKGPKLADKVSDSENAWISACFGEAAERQPAAAGALA